MPSIKALLIHSKYIKWLEIEENGGLFKSTGQHSWTILTKGPKGGIQWVLLILPGDRRLKAREQLEELFSPPASYLAFSIKLRSLYLCEIKNKTKKNPHKHKTQQKKTLLFPSTFLSLNASFHQPKLTLSAQTFPFFKSWNYFTSKQEKKRSFSQCKKLTIKRLVCLYDQPQSLQ